MCTRSEAGHSRRTGTSRRLPVLSSCGMLLLAGCLGYRVGTTLPPGVRSVHVPTFVNECGEPQVERETTRATVQAIQKDGTLRVVGPTESEAVLEGRITRYTLEPLRYDADQARMALEYRLRISAFVRLKRRGTEKPLVEEWVSGETTFPASEDLTSARLSALPAAAADLAHQIVKAVTQFW